MEREKCQWMPNAIFSLPKIKMIIVVTHSKPERMSTLMRRKYTHVLNISLVAHSQPQAELLSKIPFQWNNNHKQQKNGIVCAIYLQGMRILHKMCSSNQISKRLARPLDASLKHTTTHSERHLLGCNDEKKLFHRCNYLIASQVPAIFNAMRRHTHPRRVRVRVMPSAMAKLTLLHGFVRVDRKKEPT